MDMNQIAIAQAQQANIKFQNNVLNELARLTQAFHELKQVVEELQKKPTKAKE